MFVGAAVVAAPLTAQAAKDGGTLKVMTQNLYVGADLVPVIEAAAEDTTAYLLAAAKVYQQAVASDLPTCSGRPGSLWESDHGGVVAGLKVS